MKYVLPFTAAAVAQLLWNIVLSFNLGNQGNAFGDWAFSCNCNYGLCDGMWVMVAIWIAPFIAVVIMLIRLRRSQS